MRFKQANDYFREQWNAIPEDVTKTDKGLLKQMLNNTIKSYKSQNISDLDRYYFAFVDCIENVFPDEPWYENIGLDIRTDLFNTRSPEETAQHILDAITDADAYVEENKILTEDTVKKQDGKWTNRGDDGKEHGEFKTKKEADAQRKAMYANGYKGESIKESKFNEPTSIGKGYAAPITTDLRRHRIKDDLKYINDENPNRSRIAKNDLVRAYKEILDEINEVEEFDAYWTEHKKALMSEFKAQLDLIPADIRD